MSRWRLTRLGGQAGGSMDINAKLHAEFKGRCFYFTRSSTWGLGDSHADIAVRSFRRRPISGVSVCRLPRCRVLEFGARGRRLRYGQDGGPVAEQYECNPSGPYWEARWASRTDGNVDLVGMEMYLHQNGGSIGAANISYINVYSHDIQTKENVGWHPGCLQTEKMDGLLIDRSRFERCAIEPILLNDPFTL